MITDTCTWHTRLDTHAHTRYLYEHELGYSMEYAIGNTPSVHAAEPGRAPTCTEPPRIYTAAAHRKYLPSHRYCTYFARNPHREYRRSKVLDIISNYLDLDNRKSTDTHGKYDLGTGEPDAVLYTIDTEIHTKYVRIPPR